MVGVIMVVWWTKNSLPSITESLRSISWENGSTVIDITRHNSNIVLLSPFTFCFELDQRNCLIRIFVLKVDLKQAFKKESMYCFVLFWFFLKRSGVLYVFYHIWLFKKNTGIWLVQDSAFFRADVICLYLCILIGLIRIQRLFDSFKWR